MVLMVDYFRISFTYVLMGTTPAHFWREKNSSVQIYISKRFGFFKNSSQRVGIGVYLFVMNFIKIYNILFNVSCKDC